MIGYAPLPAVTVRQPHAWAIAYAGKPVENRTRACHYRGPLAIHAGLTVDGPAALAATPQADRAATAMHPDADYWDARTQQPTGRDGVRPPGLACGAIIAVTVVVGCHLHTDPKMKCDHNGAPMCSPWAQPGQWHWELAGVLALARPVPCVGAQGRWQVPAGLLPEVWRQAQAAAQAADQRH